MKKLIIIFILATVILSTVSACGGWPFYYKPEFRGRVLDAETKAPIEGAVVVVLYWKSYLIRIVGSHSAILNARETLTDKNGDFYFPSCMGFIPFSRQEYTQFIIYKPGYMKGPEKLGLPSENFFAVDAVGQKGQIRYFEYGNWKSWAGILGVVELKRAKTREDFIQGSPDIPTDYHSDRLPLLFKAINEDSKNRGLGGESR